MRLLKEAGAEMDARGAKGETPTHWAASRGRTEALELLAAAGADVNARMAAGPGYTPAHQAAFHGHASALATLAALALTWMSVVKTGVPLPIRLPSKATSKC